MRCTLSDDAHAVKDVGMHYDRVPNYLRQAGFTTLYYWQRRNTRDGEETGKLERRALENATEDIFWKSAQ